MVLRNPTTIEVDIPKQFDINTVFEQFSDHQMKVESMRNKTNRLEKLFLDTIGEESN